MTACDELLERLDDAIDGRLDGPLAAHLAECPDCREAVETARGLSGEAAALRGLTAPPELVQRLKKLTRLAPACDQVQDLFGLALDDDIEPGDRDRLVAHLRECRACRATWDAIATLREVGAATRPSQRARAVLAINPRRNLTLRRRLRFFDLRLATAAAYLLAALTVALAGNPITLARAGTQQVDKATFYATAAVENRIDAYGERIKGDVLGAVGWVENKARDGWKAVRGLLGKRDANQRQENDVVPRENGGS